MKHLKAYVDQKNKWNGLFNGAQLEFQTAQGRQRIAQSLDADLSPENLSCDGELPRAEVQRRYRTLTQAAQDLINLDPKVSQHIYEFNG